MSLPNDSNLTNGKREQNPSMVVIIIIINADNATMIRGDPHYSGLLRYSCIVGSPVPQSQTSHDSICAAFWLIFCEEVTPPESRRQCNPANFTVNGHGEISGVALP